MYLYNKKAFEKTHGVKLSVLGRKRNNVALSLKVSKLFFLLSQLIYNNITITLWLQLDTDWYSLFLHDIYFQSSVQTDQVHWKHGFR